MGGYLAETLENRKALWYNKAGRLLALISRFMPGDDCCMAMMPDYEAVFSHFRAIPEGGITKTEEPGNDLYIHIYVPPRRNLPCGG